MPRRGQTPRRQRKNRRLTRVRPKSTPAKNCGTQTGAYQERCPEKLPEEHLHAKRKQRLAKGSTRGPRVTTGGSPGVGFSFLASRQKSHASRVRSPPILSSTRLAKRLAGGENREPGKLNWEPKKEVAEREGFEPSIGVNLYSLSRGALSTTQPSLRAGRAAWPSEAHRSSRHWPAKRSNCGDGSMLRSVSRSADCRET